MDADIFPRTFAMGRAATIGRTTTTRTSRIIPKSCKKTRSSLPLKHYYPILSHAVNITSDEIITLIWCGSTLTDRYNKIKLLNEFVDNTTTSESYKHSVKIQCKILFKEQYIRTVFRNFVRIWLHKRYKSRFLNTEDPATMDVPRNPIHVYDTKQKGTYVFEASSLLKSTEKDLSYAQWLFPEPSHPKNPLTNLFWELGQRLHIIQQFRSLNIGSWIVESYFKSHCNLRMFRDLFMVPLKVRALNDLSRNPSNDDTIDFICEFMEDMNEHFETEDTLNLTVLKWAARHMYSHSYIESWREVWTHVYQYKLMYGDEYLDNHPILQNKIYRRAEKLLYDFKSIAELAEERLMRVSRRTPIIHPTQNIFTTLSESDSESKEDEDSEEEEGAPLVTNILPVHMEVTMQRVYEFQAARRIQALARGWLTRRDQPPGIIQESPEVIVWPTISLLPNIIVHLNNIETVPNIVERFVELLEELDDVNAQNP